jgi:hypothetical protein
MHGNGTAKWVGSGHRSSIFLFVFPSAVASQLLSVLMA